VLLPAGLIARRSYPLGVTGAALVATGRGNGYRALAAELGVPAATVRSWARRARANAERLDRFGVRTIVALEPGLLPTTPRASRLGEALEVLSAAAVAVTRRFPADQPVPPWSTINVQTQGRLLAPGVHALTLMWGPWHIRAFIHARRSAHPRSWSSPCAHDRHRDDDRVSAQTTATP
jgi:transposase-like protein